MHKPIPIHWKELGSIPVKNKLSRGLHIEMLDNEYKVQLCTTPRGATKKEIYLVKYDREYILNWLLKKVLIPFAVLEEEEVIQLIREAYNYVDTELFKS